MKNTKQRRNFLKNITGGAFALAFFGSVKNLFAKSNNISESNSQSTKIQVNINPYAVKRNRGAR